MYEGLGFGRRKLISEIVTQNWGVKNAEDKSTFSYNDLLFVIQEMLQQEGKPYMEGKSIMRGFQVFRYFTEMLLYRNLANYDSMVLITAEKGTGKSSAAMMLARQWCKLIGIKFDPKRHIAYTNAEVMNKIELLNKFEPIICLPGNTYIRIKCNGKEYNETIKNLVGRNDFEVLSYNIKKDIFEWKKPEKVIMTKEDTVDVIELENGIKIQATSNHLFLTKEGVYKRVDELTEDDELVINTKKCKICGKEYFKQMQYSKTCSKECSYINLTSNPYRKNYPEKSRAYGRKHWNEKFYNDPKFRLRHNIYTRMISELQKNNISYKNTISFAKLLGCSLSELVKHIEKQFKKGMSWKNYGNTKKCWEIDHIKGVNKFNLKNINELKECFHYTNLQPLWVEENSRKGSNDRWSK